MTTKELKALLIGNEVVTIKLENEWSLIKNTSSRLGNRIYIDNNWNVDKCDTFNSEDEAVKFFMQKVSYYKSMFKTKKMNREIEISTNM